MICAIITRDRLPWARTLAESFRRHHPDSAVYILIVDGATGDYDVAGETFETVHLDELDLPRGAGFRFQYTPFELCCALKPYLLLHLIHEKKCEKLLYLDSDIMVLSPLDALLEALDDSDVLLTPHLDTDLPRDGKRPDDGHVMLSGVFNGGFIGVHHSEAALGFLEWWSGKLRDRCIEDHFNGYFVDQKYLDLAPGLFESIGIVRHPGCNVAYWNLHSRTVSRRDGEWRCNGGPLLFYHFSDYDPDRPGQLSGHQNRFDLSELPDLDDLFARYRARLVANGYEECRHREYGFARYLNGKKIRPRTRRAYLLNARFHGIADPFDSSAHPLSLRLQSLRQGLTGVINALAMKFLRRR